MCKFFVTFCKAIQRIKEVLRIHRLVQLHPSDCGSKKMKCTTFGQRVSAEGINESLFSNKDT